MISYYKTMDGTIRKLAACEPGCWVNCVALQEAEVERLLADFSIEPEFIRAAMDEEESSHIEKEDDCTLVILDTPMAEEQGAEVSYTTTPLGIILTEKNVITISTRANPILDEFASGAVKGVQTNLKTRFVLQMMLRIATHFLQHLKQIDKITGAMERELRKSMRNRELIQLMDMQKSLVYFSSSLKANEITMEKIMRGRIIKLYEDDEDLLEDVLIEVKQAIEMSNIYLNILSGTMDAFASIISNNLNIVMKILASITLLISIPTVISGIYGMNVEGMPVPVFWFPVFLAVACMGGAFVVLKKKDML